MERENIQCDADAEDCIKRNLTPPPFEPIEGYRAILKLNGQWITLNIRRHVLYAGTAPALQEYACKRLNISKEVYLTINWPAIAKVRAHHPINKVIRISKMIYRWMPVGHNWHKCKLPSDKCPCCGCPDETFHHLLQCTNIRMTKVRRAGLSKIRLQCKQSKLPVKFTDTIISILGSFCRGEELKPHWSTEPIQQAVEAQQRIGIYHMAVGLFALEWNTALEASKVDQPQTEMELIIDSIWDNLCKPLWLERNQIKHNEANNHCKYDERNSLTDKLKWYHRHQDEVLDYRHRIFANYDPTTLHKWHRRRMIDHLDLLETAHTYHNNATSQLADNQTTLSSWIESPSIPNGGDAYNECTNTFDQRRQTQPIHSDNATSQLTYNQTTLSSWIENPTIPNRGDVHNEYTNTLDQQTQPQSIHPKNNSTTSPQERELNLETKRNTPRIHETQHTIVHKQTKPKEFDPNQKKPLLQASHNFDPDD